LGWGGSSEVVSGKIKKEWGIYKVLKGGRMLETGPTHWSDSAVAELLCQNTLKRLHELVSTMNTSSDGRAVLNCRMNGLEALRGLFSALDSAKIDQKQRDFLKEKVRSLLFMNTFWKDWQKINAFFEHDNEKSLAKTTDATK
jgi:hypothetical protein